MPSPAKCARNEMGLNRTSALHLQKGLYRLVEAQVVSREETHAAPVDRAGRSESGEAPIANREESAQAGLVAMECASVRSATLGGEAKFADQYAVDTSTRRRKPKPPNRNVTVRVMPAARVKLHNGRIGAPSCRDPFRPHQNMKRRSSQQPRYDDSGIHNAEVIE